MPLIQAEGLQSPEQAKEFIEYADKRLKEHTEKTQKKED